jgi:hypothetical protein
MKNVFFLCAVIGAAILLNSCANQATTASDTSARQQGLVDRGSVAPVSGGPAVPIALMQRFEP